MAKYYDIPDNKANEILAFDFSGSPTSADLTALQQSIQGSSQSTINTTTATPDPSGVVTLKRAGRIMLCRIDTLASIPAQTVTDINFGTVNPFQEFDIIYFANTNAGRVITFDPSGASYFKVAGPIVLQNEGDFIKFIYSGGKLRYSFSQPEPATVPQVATGWAGEETAVYDDAGIVQFDLSGTLTTVVGRKTGETAAEWTIQITAAGTAGSVTAIMDESGPLFALGLYTYTGSPTVNSVAAGLRAAIDKARVAGDHEYTSSVATDTVTIIAPDGRGATANGYTTTAAVTGSTTATAAQSVTGVDGTYQDETITAINGGTEGQLYLVKNGMTSNALILSGFGGIPTIWPNQYAILIYLDGVFTALHVSGQRAGTWGFNEVLIDHTDSPYAVPDSISHIYCNNSGGTIEIDFPAATDAGNGRELFIYVGTASNNVTLDGNGTDIDGSITKVISSATNHTIQLSQVLSQWITKA